MGQVILSPLHIQTIGRAVHEALRAWSLAHAAEEDIPNVEPHWDELLEWQRFGLIHTVTDGLNGVTPDRQHLAWCEGMRREGWAYGRENDLAAKTSPRLVAYRELPVDVRIRDSIAFNVTRLFADCFFTSASLPT